MDEIRKNNSSYNDNRHLLKGIDMNEDTKTEVIETIPDAKPKFTLNPKVKKALMWGGVAAGIILGGLLLAKTFDAEDVDECDGSCELEAETEDIPFEEDTD